MKPSLFFKETPFTLSADEASATHWAGRPMVLKSIDRIIRRFNRRNESSFDLIWANLGAGKSHTLYYLAHRIHEENNNNICVIVEIPEQIRNFRDLYQRIARELPVETIADCVLNVSGTQVLEDLSRAARAIKYGNTIEKDTAVQWLIGERPNLRQLKQVTGISARIESDSTAADVLSSLISCISENDNRMCLMLDEFQRIGKLQEKTRSQITSTLRTLLSKSPRNFSLFVAIFSNIEKTAKSFIPEELITMMGINKPITLPEMDEPEALEFVCDRMSAFRPEGYSSDAFAPLGEYAVEKAIQAISSSSQYSMIPRTILTALSALYDEVPDSGESLDKDDIEDILSIMQESN
jgi:hypothetical protein